MKFTQLEIEGAWLVESQVWPDERGFFREWFKHHEILKETGMDFSVLQANFSLSHKGVIRGIHYSLAPAGQAKWVTCVSGSVLDVVVDIRPTSKTYKKVEYINLSAKEGTSVLIGPGLGHGFLANEDGAGVSYLLTSPYSPEHEFDISPMDLELDIKWREKSNSEANFLLSPKDLSAPTLSARQAQGSLPI
jgi:dTDP-4-dehydrorhamnose 3,5-epimerase